MASGIVAAFLTGFMFLFRFQSNNYQVASDELRLPMMGQDVLGRMMGADGSFMLAAKPTVIAGSAIEDWRLSLPLFDNTLGRFVTLKFTPSASPPDLPRLMRRGTLTVTDSASGGTSVDLAPMESIASVSFYSPELVFPNGQISNGGGQPIFFIDGASATASATGFLALSFGHPNATDYVFQWANGPVATLQYSPLATFRLRGQNGSVLTCHWPATTPAVGPMTIAGATLNPVTSARRIVVTLTMATSPFTSAILLRDSVFLKN